MLKCPRIREILALAEKFSKLSVRSLSSKSISKNLYMEPECPETTGSVTEKSPKNEVFYV